MDSAVPTDVDRELLEVAAAAFWRQHKIIAILLDIILLPVAIRAISLCSRIRTRISIVRHSRNHGFRSGYKIKTMAKQELKDFKQRVEEGEFAQSAEITAS
jgi:hypothetical protein